MLAPPPHSSNLVLKEMWPDGQLSITEVTKRPQTAATLFKNSIVALVDKLGCKVCGACFDGPPNRNRPVWGLRLSLFSPDLSCLQSRSCWQNRASLPEAIHEFQNPHILTLCVKHPLCFQEPYYVRCIKPNEVKSPVLFDDARCQHQVAYLGLLENVMVRRAGFAYRQLYARFLQRWGRCPFFIFVNKSQQFDSNIHHLSVGLQFFF